MAQYSLLKDKQGEAISDDILVNFLSQEYTPNQENKVDVH